MVEGCFRHISVMTGELCQTSSRRILFQIALSTDSARLGANPDFTHGIGTDQLVDEMVAKFTRRYQMDWMLPGVARPKQVDASSRDYQFRDGKTVMHLLGSGECIGFNSAARS